MANRITVEAPAKTNLFLAVGRVQSDGYHKVTTVLCPLGLHDVITLEPAGGASTLTCVGGPAIDPEENLAMRALRAMQEKCENDEQFAITLEKNIPFGAGLGGGSSDAAAVLAAVASAWGLDPRDERVLGVARQLGADVPFFLYGGATLMDERGDHFVRSYQMPRIDLVLVKPEASVPTARAYELFDSMGIFDEHAEACHYADLTVALEEGRRDEIPFGIYNNMEPVALRIAPAIKGILEYEREIAGISRAFVSGSGSAVAILCKDENVAASVSERAEHDGHWAARTFTRNEGVTIVREDSV